MTWTPPPDLDPEVTALCRAMNGIPGVTTAESCSGHGERPIRVWFIVRSLEDLPAVLYWFAACHSGHYGWSVTATTDCARSPAVFVAEGPAGDYIAANAIAACMKDEQETTQ